MHLKTALLINFLIWANYYSFSQTYVQGKFQIGDTINHHSLYTDRGDVFLGTVTSWQADSIIFLNTLGDRLSFPSSAVSRIVVGEEDIDVPGESGLFQLTLKNGKTY